MSALDKLLFGHEHDEGHPFRNTVIIAVILIVGFLIYWALRSPDGRLTKKIVDEFYTVPPGAVPTPVPQEIIDHYYTVPEGTAPTPVPQDVIDQYYKSN